MKTTFHSVGASVDYTPVSDVAAGMPVEIAGRAGIANQAIAAGKLGALATCGLFKGELAAVTVTAGDKIGWNADGDPYGGTAGSGCYTNVVADMDFVVGTALADAANDSGEVLFVLNAFPNAEILDTLPAQAHIADVAAISAAAAALTYGDPAAQTQADTTLADSWDATEAGKANTALAAIKTDVDEVRDAAVEAGADLATQKAELDKLIADVTADKAKINATLVALETAQIVADS